MNRRIVPATGWGALLRFYDPLVRVFSRQTLCLEHILELVSQTPASTRASTIRVLDVGCGTGTFAILLAEQRPTTRIRALDADPRVLAQAGKKNAEAAAKIEWIGGDATSLPLSQDSVDIATCSLVLHHLTAQEKRLALTEILRVLVPGGRLILLDYAEPRNLCARLQFLPVRVLDGWDRTRCNAAGRLPQLLQTAGFHSIEETLMVDSLLGTMRCYSSRKP